MQHFPQCYGVFTGLLMPTADKKDSIFLKAFVSYVLKESNLFPYFYRMLLKERV